MKSGPAEAVVNYLKLTRFPLVFTAVADSAAGYLLSRPAFGEARWTTLGLLAAASACLYACGMVFNDVADALRDRVLHRDRPIPSGRVTPLGARRFGMGLMFAATLAGCLLNFVAGQVVLFLFILIMAYNFALKAWPGPGAANMALLRALNFTLGVVAAVPWGDRLLNLPGWGQGAYAHALVLAAYVFFLTLLSTLEDMKRPHRVMFLACSVAMAVVPVAGLLIARAMPGALLACTLSVAILGHAGATLRRLEPAAIMRCVRWGVIAIIPLDASFVLSGGRWKEGLAILALAVPALLLMPVFRKL